MGRLGMHVSELSTKLIEKAVKEGFDEVATLVTKINSVMAKIANSEPTVIQQWVTISVNLYLTKSRRIFVVSLEPRSLEELDKPIKELIALAGKVIESPFYAPLPKVEKVEPLNMVDKSVIDYMDKMDQLVGLLLEASYRERIDSVAGMVKLSYVKRALSTSTSINAVEEKTSMTSYIRAFAGDGSGQWSFTSTKVDTKGLEYMALTAARFANESKGRIDIEPGYYDVILSPMVFGNLINYVCRMASAFSVLMGTSIFMKRSVGEEVASNILNVYDVPRDTELPNFVGFDDEGVKTYNKPVIENGVLKTLLHNTKTAYIMKSTTTGNAGWIAPHPWNIHVSPGDSSFNEMVSEVKKGLIITNNWYTRLQNYVEGEFSTIARDAIFLIENGRITRSVNRVRIADKLLNILKNIDLIGKDLYNIHWWEVGIPTRSPYILVRNIRITKHVI